MRSLELFGIGDGRGGFQVVLVVVKRLEKCGMLDHRATAVDRTRCEVGFMSLVLPWASRISYVTP